MAASTIPAGKPRLPLAQIMVLAFSRFAEPISFAGVFPYLPSYMENLGVPKDSIAKWAGLAVFLFSACQSLTAISWGRQSDRIGRKPVIMMCLLLTGFFTLCWGFATTLSFALISRALLGACNGNVGILRTVVAEIVPWKELQPMAFAIMPMVMNVGFVVAPAITGLLSDPYGVVGKEKHGNRLLEKFPFALPNIIATATFFLCFVLVFLLFEESLASKKGRKDIGIALKDAVVTTSKKLYLFATKKKKNSHHTPLDDADHEVEVELLLQNMSPTDEENPQQDMAEPSEKAGPPPWKDVFNRQSVYCMFAYSMLALHSGSYDLLLPLLMHHPEREAESWFKFSGGFGIGPQEIGLIFLAYSLLTMIAQICVYPWMTKRIGVLNMFKITALVYPVAYLATPFAVLMPGLRKKEGFVFIFFLAKGFACSFGYPCNTILLTHSASSLKVLATLNGVLTVSAAVFRALAGVLPGAVLSYSVKRGYVIIPYIMLFVQALIGMVPVFLIKEADEEEHKQAYEPVGEESDESTD